MLRCRDVFIYVVCLVVWMLLFEFVCCWWLCCLVVGTLCRIMLPSCWYNGCYIDVISLAHWRYVVGMSVFTRSLAAAQLIWVCGYVVFVCWHVVVIAWFVVLTCCVYVVVIECSLWCFVDVRSCMIIWRVVVGLVWSCVCLIVGVLGSVLFFVNVACYINVIVLSHWSYLAVVVMLDRCYTSVTLWWRWLHLDVGLSFSVLTHACYIDVIWFGIVL